MTTTTHTAPVHDPRDVALTRPQLAERWWEAAVHSANHHDDRSAYIFGTTVAMAQLNPDRRNWSVTEIQQELLRILADLPYVEGCCTWREPVTK